MRLQAKTVDEYLEQLPSDRRQMLEQIREVIIQNLPDGYEEGIQYGMIGYFIPLDKFPDTYNGEPLNYAAVASQKNYVSIYLTNLYADPKLAKEFIDHHLALGKKLNMGKSCIRIKKIEDIDLNYLGKMIRATKPQDFISLYLSSRNRS